MQAGRYTEITVIGKGVTTATRRGCLERIYRNCENIADASVDLNDARRSWIDLQLAPQSQHLDVDAAIENILVDAVA